MKILLNIAGDLSETDLASFLADNFDSFDAADVARMVEAFAHGEAFHGGGGAAPPYTIRQAKHWSAAA